MQIGGRWFKKAILEGKINEQFVNKAIFIASNRHMHHIMSHGLLGARRFNEKEQNRAQGK